MHQDIDFIVCDMTETYARDISNWRYPSPYENYSFAGNEAEYLDIMNGLHFAVVNRFNNELYGFVALGPSAQIRIGNKGKIYDDESYTDIAFGLRPDLCGKGIGKYLVLAAIELAKKHFPDDGIRLTAEADNLRAVKLYTKMGFKKIKTLKKGLFGKKLVIMALE